MTKVKVKGEGEGAVETYAATYDDYFIWQDGNGRQPMKFLQ